MLVTDLPPPPRLMPKRRVWFLVAILISLAVVWGLVWWYISRATFPAVVIPDDLTTKPTLVAKPIISGYDHIWDVAFLPTGQMMFTERKGAVHLVQNGEVRKLLDIPDVLARGEGGLMGLAVDPAFAENRFIYTCFNSNKNVPPQYGIMSGFGVRLVRWRLNADLTQLTDRTDIIQDLPASGSGRHSGCRAKFGPDGFLYVGTGDAALGNTGINPKSIGGKVLRIDRDGKPAPGNLGGDFDPRIFSFGHRNVQGIAFFEQPQNGAVGVSIEHGSTVDDEVNLLTLGNFGWAHPPGEYHEKNVPMTNKAAYPDAIDAIWSSGATTIAPSGATFLRGNQWRAWDGALAMAVLKGKHLKLITINEHNQVTATEEVFTGEFGRLRTAVQGPDGMLYLTTDNGGNDSIIRVTPH